MVGARFDDRITLAPAFLVDHLENGNSNGLGVISEPYNIEISVDIGDRTFLIGGNHEKNKISIGVQIHDKNSNNWFSPIVLGTGPNPSKGYSVFVLKQGRILVIKKGSLPNDSIWFLENYLPIGEDQSREILGYFRSCYMKLKKLLGLDRDAPVNGVEIEGINLPAEHMVSKMEEKIIVQERGEAKRNRIVLDLSSLDRGAPGRTRGILVDSIEL
ncbi:Guanylate kinase 1 [Cardamine amara subsp. amara]|uniref:Guanylate kinase 1 n=1 Tax=Cardamine amara subsp. amara TaxID=228776 RepID=A0ABD0ZMY8_CARAN